MKKIAITGGNSGIGLEAARQLVALGHHVILLGRDKAKGAAAVASLGLKSEFIAADLSSHAGVRAAAEQVLAGYEQLDGLIHSAGHLTMKDVRTADDLHPVYAVNYLSRYHLTQLLLPALRRAHAKVILIVAGVPLDTKIDFAKFPKLKPFPGMSAMPQTQIANHHYVAHLAAAEPTISAATTNVGLVKTEIMREMPWLMKAAFTVLGPLVTIPVERAAANPVHLATHDGWASGSYWSKPGASDVVVVPPLDPAQTAQVISTSRELTGA